jgi:hypothetical protein
MFGAPGPTSLAKHRTALAKHKQNVRHPTTTNLSSSDHNLTKKRIDDACDCLLIKVVVVGWQTFYQFRHIGFGRVA